MSSQAQVRDLFSLPKKEVIFDDFGCAYSKGILHQGRMYITENYICFYSSIMGISKKLIIPLNDVTKITKAKRLGMIKALKIHQNNNKNSYKFQSFSDTDKTYSIIQRLWMNVSLYASQEQLPPSSEEDNDADDITSQASFSGNPRKKNTERAIAGDDFMMPSDQANGGGNQGSLLQPDSAGAKAGNNASQGVPNSSGQQNGAATAQVDGRTTMSQFTKEESKREEGHSEVHPNGSTTQEPTGTLKINDGTQVEAKAPGGILVEKAQGINEIQAQSRTFSSKNEGKDAAKSEEYVSKEDLDKLLEAYPIPENHDLISTVYFGFPVKDFFKVFADLQSPNCITNFYIEKGEQGVTAGEWLVPDPPEEYDGKPVLQAQQTFMIVQIKDNPFVKASPTYRYSKILEQSDTKVLVKSLGKCKDVPYCDTFSVEEEVIVLSTSPNANCCIARVLVHIIWHKSTLLKSKIQSSTLKASKQFWDEYQEWIKKKNIHFKEKKPPQKVGNLKHGIEKSNKLFEKQPAEAVVVQDVVAQDLKQKSLGIFIMLWQWAQSNRTDALLIFALLFMFRIYLKLCSIESEIGYLRQQYINNQN